MDVTISTHEAPKRARRWPRLVLLAGCLLLLYATLIEPAWLEVRRVTITLPHLPAACDGFTVVQLSDIHDGTPRSRARLRAAVARVNRVQPDLIVLTGDYLYASVRGHGARGRQVEEFAATLGALRARHGVYAIWGNHDYYERGALHAAMTKHGIRLLVNASVPLAHNGARLWLVGLDDLWTGIPAPDLALREIPAGACVVALMHEPDYADDLAAYPVDLQLSGHAHGGQIRLPVIGALHLPSDGRRYPAGLARAGTLQVYTNRGLGVTGPPVRFFCRPEITVLTLRK